MTAAAGALGGVLGVGLLLCASPWLWPRRADVTPSPGAGRTSRLRGTLAAAGLPGVSPTLLVVMSLVFAVVGGAVVLAISGVVALAAAVAVAALTLPWVLVRQRLVARRAAHRSAWPDLVDHLVSAVRAGMSLPDAVSALADVGPAPMRTAFAEFRRDWRETANFAGSLDRLKATLADPVADRIIETLRMAREVGGTELTPTLRALSAYLRSDAALRAEVSARQGWVRNAARLGVCAPWLLLLILSTRPEAIAAYNTPAGFALIAIGLGVSVVAYRLMLGLGRLPEEGRWFA
ncbi:type II secretion system F family protein [Agromyces mangrovi Wang et al. 2018]|uniref:type II secretion system F family protein n=1 Tax=Agromyces mangrovi TaxID=1858653 RepID=UPI0025735A4F|nr:type II secretion system F family protein [Agromyces mangrovi]BDZ63339.1 type II secretion system protein F [Agromyces mangrovi]